MNKEFARHGALITGAASGIGRECAAHFVRAGARAVMADLRDNALNRAAAELDAKGSVYPVAMDVRDPGSVEQAIDRAWEETGPVDILVNAAGLYPSDPLLSMTVEAWDRVLDTNLRGPFLCVNTFARKLLAEGRKGCVVNISSGAARRARPGAAHYTTSKAGLEMLTKGQALELAAHDIRVNAVAPGFIRVDSEVNRLSDDYVDAISAGIALRREGRVEDIANAVLFLCSAEAAWITGSTLSVDGGSGAGSAQLPLSACLKEI